MDKELLIEEIRKYPFLYDMSDARYSDTKKKEEAWKQIAHDLGEKKQNVRRTWLNLRESHRRAMKKKKPKDQTILYRKWVYEDQMAFLVPHYRERNKLTPTTDNEDDDVTQFLSIEDDSLNQAPSDCGSRPDSMASTPDKKFRPMPYKRKSDREASVSHLLMEYLLERKDKKEDEIEMFFSSMAATVKKFPPLDQAVIKSKIFNFISEAEQKLLTETKENVN